MEFEVKFEKDAELYFQFSDGEMEAVDAAAEEAVPVLGQITADGEEIGQIILYDLYNDELLYQKCDELSGDCETVAEAICGKNGRVLAKHLGDLRGCVSIYILDRIEIAPAFRNRGIGSAVMRHLRQMLYSQFGYDAAIFLCASAFEEARQYGFGSAEYAERCEKLISFYRSVGFEVVQGSVMRCLEE